MRCRTSSGGYAQDHHVLRVRAYRETIEPPPDTSPKSLFFTFQRGWSAGARAGAYDPAFMEHENTAIRQAYERGYNAGLDARSKAFIGFCKKIGYEPSILREVNV